MSIENGYSPRSEKLVSQEVLKQDFDNFLLTSPNSLFEAVVNTYCDKAIAHKSNRVSNLNNNF